MRGKNMIKDRKWHLVYKINMADPNAWHSIPINSTINHHVIKTNREQTIPGRVLQERKKRTKKVKSEKTCVSTGQSEDNA